MSCRVPSDSGISSLLGRLLRPWPVLRPSASALQGMSIGNCRWNNTYLCKNASLTRGFMTRARPSTELIQTCKLQAAFKQYIFSMGTYCQHTPIIMGILTVNTTLLTVLSHTMEAYGCQHTMKVYGCQHTHWRVNTQWRAIGVSTHTGGLWMSTHIV